MEVSNETLGQGCYVVPITDSSSGSSFLAVTPNSPYPIEPSPQVSSASISRSVSSCSYSDDDHDPYMRAARPSRAVDRFDTEGLNGHGPWGADDDLSGSPVVPIQRQRCDYDWREPYSEDESYLKNGYQSPVSDEETFFTCREDPMRRSDEALTNVTFSGDEDGGVNTSRDSQSKSGLERKEEHASHPIQPPGADEFLGDSQKMDQSRTSLDEHVLQEASSELTNEVLRMSLNVLGASTPAHEALMLNSNQTGNDESGFYDGGFTPPERPAQVLSVNRAVNVHIEVEETPEDNPGGLNGSPGDSTHDGVRMEILGETPMSGEVSMQLCESPQTSFDMESERRALEVNDQQLQRGRPRLNDGQSERQLNRQRELMATVEKERLSMESMLREAQRAHDEFDVLRKTVDKLIERMSNA